MDFIQDFKNGRAFEKKTSDAYERARKLTKYQRNSLFTSYHSLKSQLLYLVHPFLSLYQLFIDILRLLYSVILFASALLMLKLVQANDRFVDFLINMGAIGLEMIALSFSIISIASRGLVSLFQMKYFYAHDNDIAFKTKGWSLHITSQKALNESFVARKFNKISEMYSEFSQELKHHDRALTIV